MNLCESVLYPSPVLAFGFQWLSKRHPVSAYTMIYRDSELILVFPNGNEGKCCDEWESFPDISHVGFPEDCTGKRLHTTKLYGLRPWGWKERKVSVPKAEGNGNLMTLGRALGKVGPDGMLQSKTREGQPNQFCILEIQNPLGPLVH